MAHVAAYTGWIVEHRLRLIHASKELLDAGEVPGTAELDELCATLRVASDMLTHEKEVCFGAASARGSD